MMLSMATRQPLAISLSGFQFTYRNNYFDWRLLHGIDIDNVIRLTDVQAVEDCLDTLQRGSFAAERDRLSPSNCVQLFRLLQLAIEYCAHLRAAHALLLDCYNVASATAESWKAAARSYLDVGSAFLSESMEMGTVLRESLDATDTAKLTLEAADRDYNTALDALEAEDSRARHFRFRKQRTEISWSQLNAADADRLVASLDVGLLEAVLPNLTYGSITSEDDEQLTPHHFSQLIPLAQAALDYVLWQANVTGVLMEQAMSALQAACVDIPTLTSATQELHANITSLLMGGAQAPEVGLMTGTPAGAGGGGGGGGGGGAGVPGFGLGLRGSADLNGGGGSGGGRGGGTGGGAFPLPWASASTDLGLAYGQPQYGSGRLNTSPGFTRTSTPAHPRPRSGAPGGPPQVLRLGPSRLGTPAGAAPYSGALAALLAAPGGSPTSRASGSFASGALDELMAAAAVAGGSTGGGGAAALPVLELHNRAAELNDKVDAIEQNLRVERSKTEEMRRILADIKDRLNQGPLGGGGGGGGGGGLSPVESLTFTPTNPLTYDTGLGSSYSGYSAFINTSSAAAAAEMSGGGGGGLRYGSAAGVNISGPHYSDPTSGHQGKVRIFVDEDAIREQEQQRALQVLARQAEKLKQQMLREHQERRLATSVASAARASPPLQQMGPPAAAAAVAHGIKDGPRHSRQVSREVNPESRRSGTRRSSPGKMSRPGSSSHVSRRTQQQVDDSSDSDHAAMAALAAAAAVYGGSRAASRQGSAGGTTSGGSRPPRPGLSRLSGPTMHGSLGDLPAAATMYGMPGDVTSSSSRPATVSGSTGYVAAASNGGGGAGAGSSQARASANPQDNRFAASSAFGSVSLVGPDKEAAAVMAAAAAAAGGNISKASSFSDRMTQASQLSYRSALG